MLQFRNQNSKHYSKCNQSDVDSRNANTKSKNKSAVFIVNLETVCLFHIQLTAMNDRLSTFTTIFFLLFSSGLMAQEQMVIDGAVIISNSDDPTPAAGTIRWTGSDYEGFDGTSWITLTQLGVKDLDNNIYKTVRIGTQTWMAENLKSTKYANGDAINNGTGLGDLTNAIDPKYWFYFNDQANNLSVYGRLYTWYASADARNVCPIGWRVPSEADFITLQNFLGGSSFAGGKMKVTGDGRWTGSNSGADNTSGFTGLPGGLRTANGFWGALGNSGFFWSSDQADPDSGIHLHLVSGNETAVIIPGAPKEIGHSVRCIKD